MELHDAVELAVDLPDEGLKAGTVGTIVEVYRNPDPAYEVEFSDSEGRTVAMLALGVQQLTIAYPRREMTESHSVGRVSRTTCRCCRSGWIPLGGQR